MEAVVKMQREREQIRRIINRHTLIVEEALKKHNLPDDADMEYLVEKTKMLETLDRAIQNVMLGASDYCENVCNAEYDEAEKFKKRWMLLKMQVEKRKPKQEPPPAPVSKEQSRSHNLKLPQLELRKFNDDPRNWVPFWSQFQKIHEDKSIDDDEKYQYLCQAMAPKSKARNLVEGYAPTKGNYSNVIQMLKERFAKDEILIETYVREILKLVMSKSKVTVDVLYDKIVANLQTLETLGIVKEKYECILYPLVESSLPDNTLLNWSRLPHTDKSRLTQLLDFLKTEVEAQERLNLARLDFLQADESAGREKTVPTATCLVAKDTKGKQPAEISEGKNHNITCYFCDSTHSSSECTNASKLSLDDKKELIKKKGGCFICLRKGHLAKYCKVFIKCINCSRRHLVIMCPSLHTHATVFIPKSSQPETKNVLVNSSINTTTLLQTLIVKISSNGREKKVRALLDSGAQRTYIRAGLADEMMLEVTGSERLGHIVFGGIKKGMQVHRHIDFEVSSLDETYRAKMTALEQTTLCGNLPKVNDGNIIRKLQEQGIRLTDARESISEISLLIGSDYLGSILEPDLVRVENNLVAIKTKLGWTLQGPIQGIYNTLVTSHFAATIQENESIEFLWNIETLGIKDPYDTELEVKESEILKSFDETVLVNEEGRYEVSLMWKLGHPELEPNYDQAYKRLVSTTKKLEQTKKMDDYHGVFQNWIDEGIIEKVVDDRKDSGHYLPHHAVIKLESATTKIRPVFDASAKDRNSNSLNACIEKGPNLIEVIPKLLILFRAEAYGVISDIKKAFLQISVCPQDRGNLKLLWWNDPIKKNEVTTYRHARVPFGVACSPFLLAATINHHLKKHENKYPETAKRLKESFYVDNCVTSFQSEEEKLKFIEEATKLMEIGKFELRGWTSNTCQKEETESVLGLLWHKNTDKLQCHINLKSKLTEEVTKREILSVTQQVFDPLGFVCPVTLVPKLITQKVWSLKIGWDDKIPENLAKEYNEWISTLHFINECQVPRRLATAPLQECETSIHVFSDASKDAYAGCIFLRTKHENQVSVQLVIAKSRVTPIKRRMTLPRLELMGALIASRLYTEVMRSGLLQACKEYEVYCWTDSSVVLAWLKRPNTWKTFIGNRVNEICKNTDRDQWNHLPGICNPADLPSRGCSAKMLQQKSWWLGPQWLYLEKENWPQSDLTHQADEEIISEEQLRATAVNVEVHSERFSERLLYFNKYNKIVRLVARVLRMSPRSRKQFKIDSEHITLAEFKNAEEVIIKLIQKEHYEEQTISTSAKQKLLLIKENGILKVKTRLEFSNEDKDFIYPILLPGKEEIVSRMVQEKHRTMGHAGTQILMSSLRNSLWIIGIRRLTKKIVADCIICKRYKAKHYLAPQPPLPSDRIANTAAFEVTGIDLAGPLFLKDNSKCWIVLFTCAVYRAIHLELTDSLSTASFIMSLRRFIARRGRVRVIYTDNGTNFVGTANLLQEIDWQEVENITNSHNIRWKFSVPAAPWWGGWWERLVRVVKEMLRRILGKSVVNWIELSTILCDCEAVINSRPLTYVEMGELRPLTPMMFLHNLPTNDVPDLDQIDHGSLNIRYRYLQQLRNEIRNRFKNEYLSLLINKGKERKREPTVGEVVLIETESSRLKWPIGIIKEIFTGKDGCTRAAKVITSSGEKVRAYQRLYPLELSASDDWIQHVPTRKDPVSLNIPLPADDDATGPQVSIHPQATRSGRAINLPSRFLD